MMQPCNPVLAGFPSVGGVDWLCETTGHFEVLVWFGLCLNCTFELYWDVMLFSTRPGLGQSAEHWTAE